MCRCLGLTSANRRGLRTGEAQQGPSATGNQPPDSACTMQEEGAAGMVGPRPGMRTEHVDRVHG